MARSVEDAALMASVMAGQNEHDEATLAVARPDAGMLAGVNGDIQGLRVGVMRYRQGNNPAIIAAFDEAVAKLTALGAQVVDIESLEQPDDFWEKSYLVLFAVIACQFAGVKSRRADWL